MRKGGFPFVASFVVSFVDKACDKVCKRGADGTGHEKRLSFRSAAGGEESRDQSRGTEIPSTSSGQALRFAQNDRCAREVDCREDWMSNTGCHISRLRIVATRAGSGALWRAGHVAAAYAAHVGRAGRNAKAFRSQTERVVTIPKRSVSNACSLSRSGIPARPRSGQVGMLVLFGGQENSNRRGLLQNSRGRHGGRPSIAENRPFSASSGGSGSVPTVLAEVLQEARRRHRCTRCSVLNPEP